MAYSLETRRLVFRKTDGRCHICWGRLSLGSYGQAGGWEVEHSNPRCNGGSDRLCNLFPAHIRCNREKGTNGTRTARSWNGRTKAPLSRAKKEEIRSKNRWGWGAGLALLGLPAGLPAVLLLGLLGAAIGDSINPE
jgi:5-methylcytosine-specific restriction endonuclease McrA